MIFFYFFLFVEAADWLRNVVFVFLCRAPSSGKINTTRAQQRRLSDMVLAY